MAKRDNAVIYARVSVARSKDESMSVANQRYILTSYAAMAGIHVQRVFTDDGWSGSDFRRPAFTEMMEFVKLNRPDAILVLDLSRFGRECIEMGRYTDYVLPDLGCRLISVNDGGDEVMMTLKTIYNDYYLMDVSKKIRAASLTMAKAGKWVSGYRPYGYRQDSADKHTMIIDGYAAGIVRRIFEMRLSGLSCAKIASALNSEEILAPRAYACFTQGKEYPHKNRPLWIAGTVKSITNNETYLGHRIQLKHRTVSHKIHKKVFRPEAEWIRVENTHPAIIDQAVWDAVKEINDAAKAAYTGGKPAPSLFRGLLRCADCGGALVMAWRRGEKSYYQCGRYSASGGAGCFNHAVQESALKEILLADIRKRAATITTDHDGIAKQIKNRMRAEPVKTSSPDEPERLRKRLDDLEKKTASLYEGKVSGAITAEEFKATLREYEAEREAVSAQLTRLISGQAEDEAQDGKIQDWMALITKHGEVQEISRDLLTELVESIEIGAQEKADGKKRQDIRVVYRMVGDIL